MNYKIRIYFDFFEEGSEKKNRLTQALSYFTTLVHCMYVDPSATLVNLYVWHSKWYRILSLKGGGSVHFLIGDTVGAFESYYSTRVAVYSFTPSFKGLLVSPS